MFFYLPADRPDIPRGFHPCTFGKDCHILMK
ncbi:hypothetical protein METH_22465 (plasmid) [Leisingera methylohalidivorans DSM 14336]|uniref:Uncharacterized protein n=1 Tax=Leisingera methylohalidivorans DSM 14336 TaxID=999552 RepID=V9W1Q3_9RHOB|nr:hypothetical protein METH_22465 [Leisingera methylohalidivorans DSM 14336]